MDKIKDFIKDNGGELTAVLIDVGFNAEQAARFLPEACDDIMQSLARPARRKEQIYRVMAHADVRGLASRSGVDSPLASTGVVTLMLSLLDVMHTKSQRLASTPCPDTIAPAPDETSAQADRRAPATLA